MNGILINHEKSLFVVEIITHSSIQGTHTKSQNIYLYKYEGLCHLVIGNISNDGDQQNSKMIP